MHRSSKPLFLAIAIIAVCIAGAAIAAAYAYSQGMTLPDLIDDAIHGGGGTSVTFSMSATLLEDGEPVATFDPAADQGGPLSFLNWLSIVFTGAPGASDDVALDDMHTYSIKWSPRVDTRSSASGGSTARVVVTVTKAEFQWKNGAWFTIDLTEGSDYASDTWAVGSAAHSSVLQNFGRRTTDLGVVLSDPPALNANADFRMRYTLKADLYVDNVLVDSEDDIPINGVANFANVQQQSGTLSIVYASVSVNFQSVDLYVGTP